MTEFLSLKDDGGKGVDVIAAILAIVIPDAEMTLTPPPMPPILNMDGQPKQIGQTAC